MICLYFQRCRCYVHVLYRARLDCLGPSCGMQIYTSGVSLALKIDGPVVCHNGVGVEHRSDNNVQGYEYIRCMHYAIESETGPIHASKSHLRYRQSLSSKLS